ncbi:MAG TPA: MBL fold metallo-hydrolase [Thermoanaerobaculia bacterium]|nr:MBL fold metallo-hydrolase [Thermoanaerobaculia bacterium]
MKRFAIVAGVAAVFAGIALVLERKLIAAPPYRGPQSDHFDGERFHNHQSGWQTEGSFLKWQMTRQPGFWPKWIDAVPGPPPTPNVGGDALRVTVVNHATTLIQMDGVNILTDPIWSERCSPVSFAGPKRHRPPGIRFEDLPKIDIVLVSHNHYDHLDVPTLRALELRDAPIILSHLGNSALMARSDLTGRDLDWWNGLDVKGVKITSVPAQHFSARGLSDRDATLWGGFVISGSSGNVYFAGDTGWGKHFAEIAQRFAPIRLALLPIGAYLPRWFMKSAHITPAEAVDAHIALNAKTSVPMHYGTWALGDDGEAQPLEDLRAAIAARAVSGFEILEFGRALNVR